VQPRSLAFADQPEGTSSAGQQVTLVNSGTVPLDLAAVSVVGFADFTIVAAWGGPGCPCQPANPDDLQTTTCSG
jgi:hypothetical protein